MIAAMPPLKRVQGDTWRVIFNFAAAQDATWKSQIRDNDDELLVEFTCTYEDIDETYVDQDGVEHQLVGRLTLSSDETDVDPGVYRWDVKRTTDRVVIFARGSFEVERAVTQ